jgi:hypothetical protein
LQEPHGVTSQKTAFFLKLIFAFCPNCLNFGLLAIIMMIVTEKQQQLSVDAAGAVCSLIISECQSAVAFTCLEHRQSTAVLQRR